MAEKALFSVIRLVCWCNIYGLYVYFTFILSNKSNYMHFHCSATSVHLLLALFKKSQLSFSLVVQVTVWVDIMPRRGEGEGWVGSKDVPFHTFWFHLWDLGLDVNPGPVHSHTSRWWCRQMRKFDVSSERPNQRGPPATHPMFTVTVWGWKWGVNVTRCMRSRFGVACSPPC